MDCRGVDSEIDLQSTQVLSFKASQHVDDCRQCSRLIQLLNHTGSTAALSRAQLQRIQSAIAYNLKPVRPLPRFSVLLFICTVIFLAVLCSGAQLLGIKAFWTLTLAQSIVIFGTLAVSAGLLGVSMVGQMTPGSHYVIAPALLPIAIFALVAVIVTLNFRASTETDFAANGLLCLRNGLMFCVPAGVCFWLLFRRGAMLVPKLVGAATGELAGIVALGVLELNCPNRNAVHILAWHVGVVLVGLVAGLLLGAGWNKSPAEEVDIDDKNK